MNGKVPFEGRFVTLDFWRSVEKAAEPRRSPKRSSRVSLVMPATTTDWHPHVPQSGDRNWFQASLGGLTRARQYGFCCLCMTCRQLICII